MFPCHFKIPGHSGQPSAKAYGVGRFPHKPKVPFQQYRFIYRNHKLPPPIKGSTYPWSRLNYSPNNLMAFIFLFLLALIISLVGRQIIHEGHRSRRLRNSYSEETQKTTELEKAYQFLTKSAYQYYQKGDYHNALYELRLAHPLFPSDFKLNYINTLTLTGLCKQRGIYCDEAYNSLEYLKDNWILNPEWKERQELALGVWTRIR